MIPTSRAKNSIVIHCRVCSRDKKVNSVIAQKFGVTHLDNRGHRVPQEVGYGTYSNDKHLREGGRERERERERERKREREIITLLNTSHTQQIHLPKEASGIRRCFSIPPAPHNC